MTTIPEFITKETTFSAEEMKALKVIVDYAAIYAREDTMGVILKSGAFQFLGSKWDTQNRKVVDLADKIDGDHHQYVTDAEISHQARLNKQIIDSEK